MMAQMALRSMKTTTLPTMSINGGCLQRLRHLLGSVERARRRPIWEMGGSPEGWKATGLRMCQTPVNIASTLRFIIMSEC